MLRVPEWQQVARGVQRSGPLVRVGYTSLSRPHPPLAGPTVAVSACPDLFGVTRRRTTSDRSSAGFLTLAHLTGPACSGVRGVSVDRESSFHASQDHRGI
jgi:hypothetical protein